jgi:methylmalonyl-CoA/ethylmalonyl-CoA epimerase
MRLHHTGVVVRDIKAHGEKCKSALGLSAKTEIFHDPIQRVLVQFWGGGESDSLVELIEPTGENSPVWRASRNGGGPEHLCYETDDIEGVLQQALDKGAALVQDLAPAVAFGGRRIAFVYFLELGLIEFLEAEILEEEKAA